MSGQTEYTYQFIKEKILNGTYQPSKKLIESELAETIGVSRSTVKKALMMLERDNLVDVETNKGATIRAFTYEEIINYLEIREALEAIAIKTAAKNIDDLKLEQLESILEKMDYNINENKFDEYSMLNREFHKIIYDASKNVQAVALINTIKTQLNRIQFRTILVPGRTNDSFKEHENIYKALKSRDDEKSISAIKKHISSVREVIIQNYKLLV